MGRRMITTEAVEEDIRTEYSLRPQTLNEYIGQEKAKGNFSFIWPPWLGKNDSGRDYRK